MWGPFCPVGESYFSKATASRSASSSAGELRWRGKWRDWALLQTAQGTKDDLNTCIQRLNYAASAPCAYVAIACTLKISFCSVQEEQACSTALILACSSAACDREVSQWATRAFFRSDHTFYTQIQVHLLTLYTNYKHFFCPLHNQIWRRSTDEVPCSHGIS